MYDENSLITSCLQNLFEFLFRINQKFAMKLRKGFKHTQLDKLLVDSACFNWAQY